MAECHDILMPAAPIAAQKLELLAPAGNWDCARAAVENGADAIYFGLEAGFNARVRAANFCMSDLPHLLDFLHLRGVRGYVTLNTLVFSDELPVLFEHAQSLARYGVDAVLVQDLGVARLLREMCPQLELHASTQMTLTSLAGLRCAESLGIQRVVLPREMSLSEIRQLAGRTAIGLEAFVHGALCVAYSGQCLTSESLGGRSANRGHCAQACRLPYDLLCDGKPVPLGEMRFLLSPQDLAAHALLPDLIAAGVTAFKIEGRLKTPEYVANVTRHYRAALDAAAAGQAFHLTERQVEELELSFSRGFSPGWLQGCDHKMLVPGTSSAKRGIHVADIVAVKRQSVMVRLHRGVQAGDGLMFSASAEETPQGGRLFAVHASGSPAPLTGRVEEGVVELRFGRGQVDFTQLQPGQEVWKTDDPQLTKRLRASFTHRHPERKTPLDLWIKAHSGQAMEIRAVAASGASCVLVSDEPLPPAEKYPATVEILRSQFGRLGNTVYALRQLDAEIEGSPLAPLSLLGRMRKQLVTALEQSARRPTEKTIDAESLSRLRAACRPPDCEVSPGPSLTPQLRVMCRHPHQLRTVMASHVTEIYADFADIRQYGAAVAACRTEGVRIWLATPRVEKPGETGLFRVLAKYEADGILARNLGGLSYFVGAQIPVVADFSLNATNELTIALLSSWGAQRTTAAYDLNRDQLLDLVSAAQPDQLEVVVHQHMPMFHMEHCVFCAVLSPGTNKSNCGRPCDRHRVQLRDRVGMDHVLHADVGCRNTLFNARAQSGAELVPALIERGVRHFRVELLEDDGPQIARIVGTYQKLLRGEMTGKEVWRGLQAANRVGVTRGTMEERRQPLNIL